MSGPLGDPVAQLRWYVKNWPDKILLARTCAYAAGYIEELERALIAHNCGTREPRPCLCVVCIEKHERAAQGIEAGTAETLKDGSVHESPVPKGMRP